MLKHPRRALGKLLAITFVLFLVGLLPWVDNYAHLFGFVFGFLLSYALLPFISFGSYDRQKKIILIWVCLLSAAFLFIFLVILFYVTPVYNCKICSYFNCLPLTRDFCASQNINFKREEPIVWRKMLRFCAVIFFIFFEKFGTHRRFMRYWRGFNENFGVIKRDLIEWRHFLLWKISEKKCWCLQKKIVVLGRNFQVLNESWTKIVNWWWIERLVSLMD